MRGGQHVPRTREAVAGGGDCAKREPACFFAPRKNLQRGAAFYKLEYLILNRSPASVALMTLAARDDAQRYVKATSLMPFLSDHDPVSDTAQAKFEE